MNGKIPAAEPLIEEEEKSAVQEVLESGQIASGPKVEEFEDDFSEYIGVEHSIALNSGTSALISSLLAAGVGKGDEVIVTPYSFVSSVTSVILVGAEPVFVDISYDTLCIDPDRIEDSIDEKTKAIIPVHLYGQPADMSRINEIAEEKDLVVLEDSCQAHGAEYEGRKVGGMGDVGCFSFYATKNMMSGEGGMVTTDDEEIAEKIRMIREHGRTDDGDGYKMPGYNFMMTDVEAALGIEQLKKLDDINEKRRKNANILHDGLESEEEAGKLERPLEAEGTKHVYHQYALKLGEEKRERVVNAMRKAGMGVREGYQRPIYKEEAVDKDIELPMAEKACKEVVWLPVHPQLEAAHMRRMSWGLKHYL
ncbi:MAG: DegT/DnrJ/EryC1/StrS family aminotransferase [Candidatus Saliniplasma sp.]